MEQSSIGVGAKRQKWHSDTHRHHQLNDREEKRRRREKKEVVEKHSSCSSCINDTNISILMNTYAEEKGKHEHRIVYLLFVYQ